MKSIFSNFGSDDFCFFALIVSLLAGFLGCNGTVDGRPARYYVTGKVLVDGNPVEGATLTFEPELTTGKGGMAVTDKNGVFEAQTFDPGDGLTEGNHKVAIIKVRLLDRSTGKVITEITTDGPFKEEYLVPKKYSNTKTSGVSIEVKKGRNQLPPFELKMD